MHFRTEWLSRSITAVPPDDRTPPYCFETLVGVIEDKRDPKQEAAAPAEFGIPTSTQADIEPGLHRFPIASAHQAPVAGAPPSSERCPYEGIAHSGVFI